MKTWFTLFLTLWAVSGVAQQYKTVWSLPLDPPLAGSFESGGLFSSYPSSNLGRNVYHLGEDWNYSGNDEGDPVHAIGDGVVTRVVKISGSASDLFNGELHIEHELPSGAKVECVYLHLKDIIVAEGWTVERGDIIGYIGDGNGAYDPHAHVELRKKPNGIVRLNPYTTHVNRSTRTESIAGSSFTGNYPGGANYLAVSLHVDDLGREKVIPLERSISNLWWNDFRVEAFCRAGTAYVEHEGEKYGLIKAAQKGWISLPQYYDTKNERFRPIPPAQWWFAPGIDFRLRAKKAGITLHIPTPQGDPRFFATRARVDLVNVLSGMARLYHLDVESGQVLEDSPSNPYRKVQYRYYQTKSDFEKQTNAKTAIHVLDKRYPIFRFVHPTGGKAFLRINPNRMQ